LKSRFTSLPALAFGATLLAVSPAGAQAPSKVGIINIQSAIVSTKDGQKAVGELQTRFFAPKKAELDKRQGEIQQAQEQLNRGSNTMAEEARQKLMRDIDQKTKALNRATEDAQAELDQEQQKIMQDLGQKMMAVIDKYAKDNGYVMILDVSAPNTPVLYAANTIDITADIIALYDKNPPMPGAAPPATGAVPGGGRPATMPGSLPGSPGAGRPASGTVAPPVTTPAPATPVPATPKKK
jgi:outer membrane protein